jgi:protein-disulfide isomerase
MKPFILAAIGFAATIVALPLAAVAAGPQPVSANSLVRPGDLVFGNPHGNVTIVDFYDTACGPCRAMNRRIERLIADDPSVRYVPIDVPILGPQSVLGAKALVAASMQGGFKPLQTLLMSQNRLPTMVLLRQDATALGLDWPRLQADMASPRTTNSVNAALRRGAALGIDAVPVLYIGRNRIPGAMSDHDLRWLVTHSDQQVMTDSNTTPDHS